MGYPPPLPRKPSVLPPHALPRVLCAGVWDPAPAEDLGLLSGQCLPLASSAFSALATHLTVQGTVKNSTAGLRPAPWNQMGIRGEMSSVIKLLQL